MKRAKVKCFSLPQTGFLVLILFLLPLTACGILKKKETDPTLDFLNTPLTPQQSEKLTGEIGGNFLYGQGFGETLLNIGGILITPWYALYVLGNAGISLSGYEPLYITNLLPKQSKAGYDSVYNSVTSVPGRTSSLIAGTRYRDEETIKNRYRKILAENKKH